MSAQLKMTEPVHVKPVDPVNRLEAIKWWGLLGDTGFKQDLIEQYHRNFPNYPRTFPMTGLQIEYLYNNYRA